MLARRGERSILAALFPTSIMSDPIFSDKTGQVDLSSLRLMPDWVADIGKEVPKQKFRDFDEEREGREHGGGRRDDRRRGGGGGRPGGRDREDRGARPGGGGGRHGREGFGGKGKGRGGPRDDRRGPREPEQREPLPADIDVRIEVEEKAADALAAHIKHTGRAFSMFDASRLVLGSGERFHARFTCAPERPAGLFRVASDGALFMSREEAARYILNSGALAEYYRTEEVEQEEPKGEFKSIGVCGMSGALLGPPSHHSYQPAIVRLHREKFANLALDDFKRRIRVESDPELVAKWKEQQRKGIRWVSLKNPADGDAGPPVFATRAEMESHFRLTFSEGAVVEEREAVVPGTGPREKLSRVLAVLLHRAVENARNHLFEFSQHLGHALEHRGLKQFKRRGGKIFISRVRPKAIDPGVVFSERVTAIVDTVKERPGILLSKLIEAIASGDDQPPPAPAGDAPAGGLHQPTDAQVAVMKDLRWLADEGYVVEYSDGAVFLGVQGEAAAPPKTQKHEPSKADAVHETAPAPAADAEAHAEPVEPGGEEPAPEDAATPPAAAPEAAAEPAPESGGTSTEPVVDGDTL